MSIARELRSASTRELRARLTSGHPVDAAAIEGWTYRGTSLGLPSILERLTWKTFQKTFWRAPASGRLLGWNVRLEQDGVDAPSRPRLRGGQPVTEWHYEVVEPRAVPAPPGFDRGLIIDYARGSNPPGPIRMVKDPLVALEAGRADVLLGVSYLCVAGRCVETPTYFTLEREAPIDHVPYEHAPARRLDPLRLSARERAWAEALFVALLGRDDFDRARFWRRFDEAPPPLVRAGLRPLVHALTFLPVASGYGRPFHRLTAEERGCFLEAAARDRRYAVRQAVVTLKTLACLAYFDDPRVRARFEGAA